MLFSCVPKQEVQPPIVKVTPGIDEEILFSWRKPAKFTINIDSQEDLHRVTVVTTPDIGQLDTTFGNYVHKANLFFTPIMKKGQIVADDSVYRVVITVQTTEQEVKENRRILYRDVYPKIDSNEITLSLPPFGNFFWDIVGDTAYTWGNYLANPFDLVFFKDPSTKGVGNCLAVPDAAYLPTIFMSLDNNCLYQPDASMRYTEIGECPDRSLHWPRIDARDVEEAEFTQCFIGGNSAMGRGVSNLQKGYIYKVELHNGRKCMIYIEKMEDSKNDCKVTIKSKFQVED